MDRVYAYPQVTFLGSGAGAPRPPVSLRRHAQPAQRDLVRASLVLCPDPPKSRAS